MLIPRSLRVVPLVLGLAIFTGPVVLLSGCDAGTGNETKIPEEKPAEKGKDSMDYYRNQMSKKGATKAAPSAPK